MSAYASYSAWSLALVAVLTWPTSAYRVWSDDEVPSAKFGNGVNFDFMSKQHTVPTPTAKKSATDIKEWHTCHTKGAEAETYYMSSMCYWLPDMPVPEAGGSPGHGPLTWARKSGNVGGDINLCPAMHGKGKCLKCAACHDNTVSLGHLGHTSWVEEVPLPDDCLTETQIERSCLQEFNSTWPSQETEASYHSEKNAFMLTCAPMHYSRSCEKACIEAQGCAVMEGAQPTTEKMQFLQPVKAPCSPPQPSWIYAGLSPPDNQCARYEASQQPQYAQFIRMKGALVKQSRGYEWQKRFFVLESGDSARSAKLRYFSAKPTSSSERVDKSLALWTATRIEKRGYRMEDLMTKIDRGRRPLAHAIGDAMFPVTYFPCVKIYAPTKARLCVPGDREDALPLRDEWLAALKEAKR